MQRVFSVLETFRGQNEQLSRQQIRPDRYKQSRLWFLWADPRGLSEGKKPRGTWAADLTLPPCPSTPTGLWSVQTGSYQIARWCHHIWREMWTRFTLFNTDSLCYCQRLYSLFATEIFECWTGGETGLSSLLLTHTLLHQWCHVFKQWSVCIDVKPRSGCRIRSTGAARVMSRGQNSALTL